MKERITARLRETTPVPDPELLVRAGMAPDLWRALFPSPPVPAAVLVPLIERPEGLTVLLTQRAENLRDHPGQISFPGGRLEPADSGPRSTALREAREELGIEPGSVEVIGYLNAHPVVTGFIVTPVVGILPNHVRLQPHPAEVAGTFEVPLAFFSDSQNLRCSFRQVGRFRLPLHEYRYDRYRIWGATAAIIKDLVEQII